ncbi:MAG: metal-sensitive transcriptional regulator [Spartobacteria bacterium]|nr:metal-sensitive transcriptional regulator [Spartobacteria bacterium]
MNRLARIEGQINGIRRMIEEEQYCIDIITQIQAARAALQSMSNMILKKHMENCVVEAFQSEKPEAIEKNIKEVMTVISRMQR